MAIHSWIIIYRKSMPNIGELEMNLGMDIQLDNLDDDEEGSIQIV